VAAESVWEHMKRLFYPIWLFSLFRDLVTGTYGIIMENGENITIIAVLFFAEKYWKLLFTFE